MIKNKNIFDGHVHTHGGYGVDNYLRNAKDHLSASGLAGENLICVRHGAELCNTDALALLAKYLMPEQLKVSCNPGFKTPCFDCSAEGLREQIQDFIDAGMDGVKMAAGECGEKIPIDSEIYDLAFDLMEKEGFPLLYHVGAPLVIPPKRALQKIHFPPFLVYHPGEDDDQEERPGIDPELLEQHRSQMEHILKRHPQLRVTFAHMYFMYDDLERLADFLNRYPCTLVDLTPCPEIFYYLSKNPKQSREFICEYSDRIIFGTDNTMEADPTAVIARMRNFFETDDVAFVPGWGFDMTGIAPLPEEVLEKIYKGNILKRYPFRPVEAGKAKVFCEKIYDTLRTLPQVEEKKLAEVLEAMKRF